MLAPRLSPAQRAETLGIALSTLEHLAPRDLHGSALAIGYLAPTLDPEQARVSLLRLLQHRCPRGTLLLALRNLYPRCHFDPEVTRDVVRSITDVKRWWP